jgi:hypothetical protein
MRTAVTLQNINRMERMKCSMQNRGHNTVLNVASDVTPISVRIHEANRRGLGTKLA